MKQSNKKDITPLKPEKPSILEDFLRSLLAIGADCNIKNVRGQTPLHLACQYGMYKLVDIMVSQKGIYNIYLLQLALWIVVINHLLPLYLLRN